VGRRGIGGPILFGLGLVLGWVLEVMDGGCGAGIE